MKDLEAHITTSVAEAKQISEAIDDLAKTEDIALFFSSMSIVVKFSGSDTDNTDTDGDIDAVEDLPVLTEVLEWKAKALAEFFFQEGEKCVCDQNPDIGSVIENYVHSCDIVADKWSSMAIRESTRK